MTCGYRNSAGTDLDSLFLVNNSNAGALGFITGGGQDLGNRFATGSLGYNVGYKNSAGTDIGYLRSNTPPYTHVLTVGHLAGSKKDLYGYISNDGVGGISPNTIGGYGIHSLYVDLKRSNYRLRVRLNGNCSSSMKIRIIFDDIYDYTCSFDSYNYDSNYTNYLIETGNANFANYVKGKLGSQIYLKMYLV